jgi:hypothetical protein
MTIAQAKARNEALEKKEREVFKRQKDDDEDGVPDIISRLRKRR